MKKTIIVMAALASAACSSTPQAVAPGTPAHSAVADTSFADASGLRTIQISALIPASPAEVYQAIATAEGWKTWAVPNAFGDVKIGAIMETSYAPGAKPGDANNIKQEFLALLPNHLVVFRTVKTPAGFTGADILYKTVTTLEINPEGAGQSRVTLSHGGFASGGQADVLYSFFREGNAHTLEQLRTRFVSGPIDFAKRD